MILILLSGAGFLFGIIQFNSSKSNNQMVQNSVSTLSSTQASNNASSGIDIAIQQLSEDTTWTGVNNMPLTEGSVKIIVAKTTSKYFEGTSNTVLRGRLITSIGAYNNNFHTIRAVVQLPGQIMGVPNFFKYSMASDGNITLDRNNLVTDDNNKMWNANIHTNGNFFMYGNPIINGFVTYKGNGISDPAYRLNTNIRPNYNPNNLPVHNKAPELPIPLFKPEDFESKATIKYNNSVTISGNQNLGTKANPAIIFVNGDLTVRGNFTGYGVFVVKGNVNVNGSIDFTSVDPTNNNLGIYTSGNVTLKGAIVRSQILSNGNIFVGSNLNLYGGIITKGNIIFEGDATFNYHPPTPELTIPFFKGDPDGSGTRPLIISLYD
jgi:hypothetical protein